MIFMFTAAQREQAKSWTAKGCHFRWRQLETRGKLLRKKRFYQEPRNTGEKYGDSPS